MAREALAVKSRVTPRRTRGANPTPDEGSWQNGEDAITRRKRGMECAQRAVEAGHQPARSALLGGYRSHMPRKVEQI